MIFLNGTTNIDQPCYLILKNQSNSDYFNEMNIKHDLEKGSIAVKISVLKRLIRLILSGERVPNVLMTVIRFVLPLQDHTIKKLLLIFWEIIPKTTPDGKLLEEMILVCDAFRKDLQHPNEFIRGATLRYLCKLKEAELLEPLMPSIRQCLEHRHSYVKRNTILTIFAIYKNFEFLIPDALEIILTFLDINQDMACKRNAFMMLLNVDKKTAFNYLISILDQMFILSESLQLILVESIYQICLENPIEKPRFLRSIYNLLNSNNASVRFEAAGTLVTLSSAPTAIKASASTYIDLALKESDNNVKLIVLHHLNLLKSTSQMHEKVLQDLVMDILHILSSSDIEVRQRTLYLVSTLITKRNIDEVVILLKKEVTKTINFDCDDTGKYRKLLVKTLHTCSTKFPEIIANVIPILVEFLSDSSENNAASDVINFILEAVHKFEHLRRLVIKKLLAVFASVKHANIHRSILWILGEFATTLKDIENFMEQLRMVLGKMPLIDAERELSAKENEKVIETSSQPLITSDGSYASQSVFNVKKLKNENVRPIFRQYFMDGEYFIGVTLAMTLIKLLFRYENFVNKADQADFKEKKINQLQAEMLLIMSSIIHFGKSGISSKAMNNDDFDHILMCIQVISEHLSEIMEIFTTDFRRTFNDSMFTQQENNQPKDLVEKISVDQTIKFEQLTKSLNNEFAERINMFEESLNKAIIGEPKITKSLNSSKRSNVTSNKLNKITQLTGFSDPVYAEAVVHVNEYDILLDVFVVNQTEDILQNCMLELTTFGDLKLVEKPLPITLPPKKFANIKASVKVTSTENGIIFGNIVYDISGMHSDSNVVNLNDIHIDIMDYIVPAHCTDSDFRNMWAEFEWENKITVVTKITNLNMYLEYLIKNTNMMCLTSKKALGGDCGFLAANLYAKSIFGEDALANVCVEKPLDNPTSPVTGHVRIRAKSQGMALSLGDKINVMQKSLHKKNFNLNQNSTIDLDFVVL